MQCSESLRNVQGRADEMVQITACCFKHGSVIYFNNVTMHVKPDDTRTYQAPAHATSTQLILRVI